MNTAAETHGPEAQLRALLDRYVSAIRARDLDAITAHYSPDIVAFDAILQLQFRGLEAYRQHWQMCLESMHGEMSFEIHELTLHAHGDLAFGHYLCRCGGTDEQGQAHGGWMRVTAGFAKLGGDWKLLHEHFSAPFDPQSGKALFDLQP
jgi:ketosteroid isomerase-like protein